MATVIRLECGAGGRDGFAGDLPLEHDLEQPILVDASALTSCHPMQLVRLHLFVDWHRDARHDIQVHLPSAQRRQIVAVRRMRSYHDVEDVAGEAIAVLAEQTAALAIWGDAMHMAISELCDNALQHGENALGAYICVDRIEEPQPTFRLAIADLGIGIPEHVRAEYPEWQDDSGAIGQALERGVTGTGDPYRGNGFAEVFDVALENELVRQQSSGRIDIRSGKGRVAVELVGGVKKIITPAVDHSRRGTWITYTVTSI